MTTAPVPSITADQLAELTDRHGIPAEALQVLRHVAGLYSGGAISGDPTQLFITGHHVWLARQGLERLVGASRTKADEPDACLRARVADLLHLLQFAKFETSSPGDAAQAEVAMNDLERMLAAAPAAPVQVAQKPVAFYWKVYVDPFFPQEHGPFFGWPSDEARKRAGSSVVPIPLYTAPPAAAAEQPDTVKVPQTETALRLVDLALGAIGHVRRGSNVTQQELWRACERLDELRDLLAGGAV